LTSLGPSRSAARGWAVLPQTPPRRRAPSGARPYSVALLSISASITRTPFLRLLRRTTLSACSRSIVSADRLLKCSASGIGATRSNSFAGIVASNLAMRSGSATALFPHERALGAHAENYGRTHIARHQNVGLCVGLWVLAIRWRGSARIASLPAYS